MLRREECIGNNMMSANTHKTNVKIEPKFNFLFLSTEPTNGVGSASEVSGAIWKPHNNLSESGQVSTQQTNWRPGERQPQEKP